MNAGLAGGESNLNASDDNSCDTDSDGTIHFHRTIGFLLVCVTSRPNSTNDSTVASVYKIVERELICMGKIQLYVAVCSISTLHLHMLSIS